MFIIIIIVLAICVGILLPLLKLYSNKVQEIQKTLTITLESFDKLAEEKSKLLSQKKSSEVRTGFIIEKAAPFLDVFKYDPQNAHFMGAPIDYIVFNDDEIIFMDVKSGNAQLNKRQRDIRDLVNNKKVRWETIRVDGKPIETLTADSKNSC
jgi:predicted Holliday junction resolvase-like endonuclease